MNFKPFSIFITLSITLISSFWSPRALPVTSQTGGDGSMPQKLSLLPASYNLNTFLGTLNPSGDAAVTPARGVIGVYVPGVMALPVVQQPGNQAGFVSTQNDTLTQFRMATKYSSYGFLAHNRLSGSLFPYMQLNQEVVLVMGDGSLRYFRISTIQQFQALTPDSPYSKFVDLASPDKTLTAADLFYSTYGVSNQVIFQTCIEKDNLESWGRLFITAVPLDAGFYDYLGKFSSIN